MWSPNVVLVQSVGVELVASFTTQSFGIGYQTSKMSKCKVSRVEHGLWEKRWLGQVGHGVCGCHSGSDIAPCGR